MDLAGRCALVTGGGTGVGRAVVLDLARAGAAVAVNYSRSEHAARATADEARQLGVRALAVAADVADAGAVRAMVERVVADLGGLDMVVNSAGITVQVPHADLDGLDDAAWDRVLGVNLKGPFNVIRAAAPYLRQARGAVVNIGSIAGVHGIGSSLPYCASKAALNNLTVTLARVLAPEVRINTVAPGFIDTRWWQERPEYALVREFAEKRALLHRICQPEDVARLVLDLLRNDLVTGEVVVIDGGMARAL